MAVFADPSIGEALVERLNADSEFEKYGRWFDGQILLESDDGQVWLKVYKGKVIDHLPFMPMFGYTFTLSGSDSAWGMLGSGERPFVDLLTPGARHFEDDPELETLGEMVPSLMKLGGDLMEAGRVTEIVHLIAAAYVAVANR